MDRRLGVSPSDCTVSGIYIDILSALIVGLIDPITSISIIAFTSWTADGYRTGISIGDPDIYMDPLG